MRPTLPSVASLHVARSTDQRGFVLGSQVAESHHGVDHTVSAVLHAFMTHTQVLGAS